MKNNRTGNQLKYFSLFFPQRCLWNNLPYLQQTSHYGQGLGLSRNGKDGFLRGNRRKYEGRSQDMVETQKFASGRKEQKACQWFGTRTSNNVPRLPAASDDTIEMRKIAKTMDKTSLPRANHLKESDLKKIARADMKRDGKA